MATHRVLHEPAYVLHRYDWSESSLILEVFTRHHGRIALVAKGVKRPSSSFRPVLLPLQPLQLSWGGGAEIRTLKAAEWVGGHVMPTGEALLSGYYLNELLLRLTAREDAHGALFDAYADAVRLLATPHDGVAPAAALQAACLRAFELLLLREAGLLPVLNAQTSTLTPLAADARYVLAAEVGLREAVSSETALGGSAWTDLQRALDEAAPFVPILRTVSEWPYGAGAALRTQLRELLHYHCGVSTLRTRQMMSELLDHSRPLRPPVSAGAADLTSRPTTFS